MKTSTPAASHNHPADCACYFACPLFVAPVPVSRSFAQIEADNAARVAAYRERKAAEKRAMPRATGAKRSHASSAHPSSKRSRKGWTGNVPEID